MPAQASASTPGRLASAITVGTPDSDATRAAVSLDAMPPLPRSVPAPLARLVRCWSNSTISSMSEALELRRGSSVSTPAVSVSSTSSSAWTRFATSAARRSLSPHRISSSATASFSLTTGTTSKSRSLRSVADACTYCVRITKSRGTSSTWPATTPRLANTSRYMPMSALWPTVATACSVSMLAGRRSPPMPNSGSPAAIAPLVTTTTRQPCDRRSATSAQNFSMDARSMAPATSVSEDVPILATIVRVADGASTAGRSEPAPVTGRPCAGCRCRSRRPQRRCCR